MCASTVDKTPAAQVNMSISTKTGDKGNTSLFAGGRTRKSAARVKAYGDVDELNSQLGLILSVDCIKETKQLVGKVQHELFIMGADLSTPLEKDQKRITSERVDKLTEDVELLEGKLEPLKYFILPGGSSTAAQLHIARTICRRAERSVVDLADGEKVNPEVVGYLNRLSDLLFLLARWENKLRGLGDVKVEF